MTMEEHCPHGSGNAVWCAECEREDRDRAKRRHEKEMKEKELAAEFMEMCKGLPANTVARLMKGHIAGSYNGCPKKDMAEVWAKGGDHGCKLTNRRELARKLKAEPRQTKEQKAERARKRLVAKQVKRLDTYEAVHGIRSKSMQTMILEMDDDVLEAWYAAIERERILAQRRMQSAKSDMDEAQSKGLVVDKEIRRRRRNNR